MRQWWLGLEQRERRTLILGVSALAVILAYFLLWRPAHLGATRAATKLRQEEALLTWMQRAAAEARQLQQSGGGSSATNGQSLFALADQSARAAGLADAIRRVEPSGADHVRISLQDAAFDRVVTWLGGLSAKQGVAVDAATIRQGKAPGKVNAQLVLKGPAQ